MNYFSIYIIILFGILIKSSNPKHFDILKEFGYKDKDFNSITHFLRINSPKPSKLFVLSKVFNADIIKEFSFHSIFRFGYEFSKSFVLLFLKSENNLNKLWIYVENGEILVDIKIDNDITMVAFPNPTVFDNKWHKIVLLYNEGKLKLYVDCNLIQTNVKFPEVLNYLNFYYINVSTMYLGDFKRMKEQFKNFDVKAMVLRSGNDINSSNDSCTDIPSVEFFKNEQLLQQKAFIESHYECQL